jgi:hypothetical protein
MQYCEKTHAYILRGHACTRTNIHLYFTSTHRQHADKKKTKRRRRGIKKEKRKGEEGYLCVQHGGVDTALRVCAAEVLRAG